MHRGKNFRFSSILASCIYSVQRLTLPDVDAFGDNFDCKRPVCRAKSRENAGNDDERSGTPWVNLNVDGKYLQCYFIHTQADSPSGVFRLILTDQTCPRPTGRKMAAIRLTPLILISAPLTLRRPAFLVHFARHPTRARTGRLLTGVQAGLRDVLDVRYQHTCLKSAKARISSWQPWTLLVGSLVLGLSSRYRRTCFHQTWAGLVHSSSQEVFGASDR